MAVFGLDVLVQTTKQLLRGCDTFICEVETHRAVSIAAGLVVGFTPESQIGMLDICCQVSIKTVTMLVLTKQRVHTFGRIHKFTEGFKCTMCPGTTVSVGIPIAL
jgi:hypothetical protein